MIVQASLLSSRRRDSSILLAKWGACLTGDVLAKCGVARALLWTPGMGHGLTMAVRREITTKYART